MLDLRLISRLILRLAFAALLAVSLLLLQAAAARAAKSETAATDLFAQLYLLPPPLPTRGRVGADEQSLLRATEQRNTERKDKAKNKAFVKSHLLVPTFDLPSLESRKAVQSTERFRKLTALPDPMEKMNRGAFRSTILFEKIFYRPLAKGWRKIPRPITAPIINFSRNLSRTSDFLNALAQGNPKRASEVFFSFVLDSTLGFGGLINLSKHLGIPQVEEDFGQTLAHYGVGHGAYFVSFLLGPSSIRDTIGSGVDLVGNIYGKKYLAPYWNPLDYLLFIQTGAGAGVSTGISIGLGILQGVDSYSRAIDQIDALEKGSLDFYVATRRFYAYRRALQVLNVDGSPPAQQEQAQPDETPQNDPFTDDPFADTEE